MIWQAVITGAFTLAGVGAGQWMSRRSASDVLDRQLNEQRRLQFHEHLAELVVDVAAMVESAWLLLPAISKMNVRDQVEFVDTDTGRELRERNARINANLTRLGLGVSDGALRDSLSALEVCIREWPDKAVGPVYGEGSASAGIDGVIEGFKHVRATRSALNAVQQQAARHLAVPVLPAVASQRGGPLWRSVRRRRRQSLSD